jgi:hypothetical protein
MTITQDKYCYTDTNPDGTKTIKGILEFTDVNGKDKACVFRVHLDSKTVLLSELVGLHYSSLATNDLIPNLIWKQYLESTGIQPADIQWIKHGGTFDGCSGSHVDIRYPYRAINPRTNRPSNDYSPAFIEWNGNKFEYSDIRLKQSKTIVDESQIKFFQSYFGTVEEITDRFNWRKGVNRLDIEYRVDRINSDGSKTIKTIYHWEHPDYPSHCLLRILLHPKRAIIIMSSLKSNIPPHRSVYYNYPINTLGECLIQVVNGIYQKYQYELSQYQRENTIWIYEHGEFSSPDDRYICHEPSYFRLVNLAWNGSTLDYLYSEDDEDNDNYARINNKSQIDFFRSSRFGTVEESLAELGWFNR